MANIQIKRSTGSTAPTATDLTLAGELGWIDGTSGNGTLYIKNAANNAVIPVGGVAGGEWGLALLDDTALTGNTTAENLSIGTNGTVDLTAGTTTVAAPTLDPHAATKKYVDDEVAGATPAMANLLDTDITVDANGKATDASVLIYDHNAGMWEDQRIGATNASHVTVNKEGVSTIVKYPASLLNMSTDTTGAGFIKSIAAVDVTQLTITQNSGNADGDTVTIGLPNTMNIPNDLVVGGNLTVSGTSTQVNTNTIELEDPLLVLGDASQSTTGDRGVELRYNVGGNATVGFFGLDSSSQKFAFYKTAVVANNTVDTADAGTVLGDAVFGNITGTLTSGPQAGITGVGTITTGTWESANKIGAAFGGTGTDSSGINGGVAVVGKSNQGEWTYEADLDVGFGGTGATSFTSNGVLYGNGAGALQATALGTAGQFLKAGAGGTPEWSDTVDGGVF